MRTENLHITLAFLGAIDHARFDELVGAAGTVRHRPLELLLDQPGYWKHNKIAWLGASEVPAALESTVADLRAALSAAGFRFDPKPFVAHITLLRAARAPRELPALDPVRWQANGFALMASENDRSGPHYRTAAPFFAASGAE